jgi:hypothetical protein
VLRGTAHLLDGPIDLSLPGGEPDCALADAEKLPVGTFGFTDALGEPPEATLFGFSEVACKGSSIF